MLIHIENCNNIKSANICIKEKNMNIFFGRNGSGKSTIARAISLISQGQKLDMLRPYGLKEKGNEPIVSGISSEKIWYLMMSMLSSMYIKKILLYKMHLMYCSEHQSMMRLSLRLMLNCKT